MSENMKLNYHEMDFLVPVHRFNIQFSYVTKQGLSFIREFVLRLVQLAPMKPSQIATYIGLNKDEVDEAISDLMDKGDLRFNGQGLVELTPQSTGYFDGIGNPPKTSSIQETGATLSFELCGFNCIGNKRKFDRWKQGVELKIDNKKLSCTENLAKETFQKEFYKYLDKEYLRGVRTEGNDRPSIYTMDSVNKLTKDALRLTCKFYLDADGRPIERDDFDELDDSTDIHELITKTLGQNKRPSNISKIAFAMNCFADVWTKKIFNDISISPASFAIASAESLADMQRPQMLSGPLYSEVNWKLISGRIHRCIKNRIVSGDKSIKSLVWVAPSDPYWGKSSRIIDCLMELEKLQLTSSKNPERIYSPKLYLPISSPSDRKTLNKWIYDFRDSANINYGLAEGFMDGNVEILYLEDEFVVVCYHINQPENLPVTLPVGFISTDINIIKHISQITDEYINSSTSHNNSHNFGLLRNL
ncbi:hypothetical protein ABUJ42_13970 [Salmonella enterica subsp. enterica serovar Chester]|nr:hypothetical protein [Salmonella enterica]GAS61526.1 hypothetical protein NGUA38_00068 [Salmonella enterica]